MSSFKNQGWSARFGAMGDQAEAQFEAWASSQGIGYVRFGLDRPPVHVPSLPVFIRYTPDYLTAKAFYEVQGFGRDQLLKVKTEKLNALDTWDTHHDVKLFTFDATNDRSWIVDLETLVNGAPHVDEGVFDPNTTNPKRYHAYSADWLSEHGAAL